MATDPDWTDPCAVLAWLRPQFYKVQAGRHVTLVRSGDHSETRYGAADIGQLQALMRQLEVDCAKKQGITGRRRAFTAG